MKAAHAKLKSKLFTKTAKHSTDHNNSNSNNNNSKVSDNNTWQNHTRGGDIYLSTEDTDEEDDVSVLSDTLSKLQVDIKREVEQDRDKRIQQEIRRLQAETVRLERQWTSRAKEEMERIKLSRNTEEQLILKRQNQLSDEIMDVTVEKEELLNKKKMLTIKLNQLENEIREVEENYQQNKKELENILSEYNHMEVILNDEKMREEKEWEDRISTLTSNMDQIITVMKQLKLEYMQEKEELERKQEEELAALDREVCTYICMYVL